jgi:glutathione S-transferase
MTDDVILYYNPRSRAAMAHWMLEEVGAPYRTELIDFEKGDNRKPGFLAINPMGKLPTIVHRGVTVTETGAIIAYLADAFPDAGMAPKPGDPQRGAHFRWLFFGQGCFEPALIDAMFKRPPVEQKGAVGWGSYEDVIAVLKAELAKAPYLLGERFTAADLYLASQLGFAMMFGAPGLKGEAVVEDYVARCQDRPAYRKIQSARG